MSEYHIQALAIPAIGLANEFTAFMVPHSLVTLRPRHLASYFEMKLCVTPMSSNARMAWLLTVALTYMSHFFVGAYEWLLGVQGIEVNPCWVGVLLSVMWSSP